MGCLELLGAGSEGEDRAVVAVLVLLILPREGLETPPLVLVELELFAGEGLVLADRDDSGLGDIGERHRQPLFGS